LAFKVVGRSRSGEEATIMEEEYKKFIYTFPLDNNIKDLLPQVSGGGKENDSTLVVKRLLEELFLEKECF
ncbi:5475_t:CDS:2, partial [Cetraspora pellucida]